MVSCRRSKRQLKELDLSAVTTRPPIPFLPKIVQQETPLMDIQPNPLKFRGGLTESELIRSTKFKILLATYIATYILFVVLIEYAATFASLKHLCTVIPVSKYNTLDWLDNSQNFNLSRDIQFSISNNACTVIKNTAKSPEWEPETNAIKPEDETTGIWLLIGVFSSPGNFLPRQAIRDTWGSVVHKHTGKKVALVFLLGRTVEEGVQDHIKEESAKYHDLVQMEPLDEYRFLTNKSVALLQWTHEFCLGVKYLLKIDDDVYMKMASLIRILENSSRLHRMIMGNVLRKIKPDRNPSSKWCTPVSAFPDEYFPTYINGPAYVISGDLIIDLLKMTSQTRRITLEDVYVTGMCAYRVSAVHVGHCGFESSPLSSWQNFVISNSRIMAHGVRPADMISLWHACQRMTSSLHLWMYRSDVTVV